MKSGYFRSPDGADDFCRIRGYILTVRKQEYSILDGLTSVFAGQPYMPRLQACSSYGAPTSDQASAS